MSNIKKTLDEIVATSSIEHKKYEEASKDAKSWCDWADNNPNDSLKIWISWKKQGYDTSVFSEYFAPNLTKCGNFPNALGYGIHIGLKSFWFEDEDGKHRYSTTPINRTSNNTTNTSGLVVTSPSSISQNATTIQTDSTQETEFDSIFDRMNSAVNSRNEGELESIYLDAKRNNSLTFQQSKSLERAYRNGLKAIEKYNKSDEKLEAGKDKRSDALNRRGEKKQDNMNKNLEKTDLNEIKQMLLKAFIEEHNKIKNNL